MFHLDVLSRRKRLLHVASRYFSCRRDVQLKTLHFPRTSISLGPRKAIRLDGKFPQFVSNFSRFIIFEKMQFRQQKFRPTFV